MASSSTGVTVHLVDEGMDTGPILAQAAVPVVEGDAELTAQESSGACHLQGNLTEVDHTNSRVWTRRTRAPLIAQRLI